MSVRAYFCYMEHSLLPDSAYANTKPHYQILDGLRGVAAILVVIYHVFEGLAISSGSPSIIVINHGYLAVDFFFILSGFVVGYAYDDRIGKSMSLWQFAKRRLIRLHPMIVLAAVLGAISFFVERDVLGNGEAVPGALILLALLCTVLFIPAVPQSCHEVRGGGEMFPLNGPVWSLFFEYIGNLLYALFIHRLSNKTLLGLTVVLGSGLAWFAVTDASACGFLSVGWKCEPLHMAGGLLRMLFPFCAGLLMARCVTPGRVRGAFWICSAALIVLFMVPYLPGAAGGCLFNGIYEAFCIICLFPLLLWVGASGTLGGGAGAISSRVCNFLGNMSYPLYAVHYPVMYLLYSWMLAHEVRTLQEALPMGALAVICSLLLAFASWKFYDVPVRRWLTRIWRPTS